MEFSTVATFLLSGDGTSYAVENLTHVKATKLLK